MLCSSSGLISNPLDTSLSVDGLSPSLRRSINSFNFHPWNQVKLKKKRNKTTKQNPNLMPRNYSAKPRWGWDFAGQSYGFMQDFTRLFYIQRNKEQPTYCSKPCARCYLPQPSASDSLPCILSACGHFAEFWKGKSPFCLFTSKGTHYKQGKVYGFKCLFSFLFLSLFFLFFLSALPSFLHSFSPPLSSFSLPLSFPLSLPSLFFFFSLLLSFPSFLWAKE